MRKVGLLGPRSKTRLEHMERATGSPAERHALRTSFELTKGGRPLWMPEHVEVPIMGKGSKDAIGKGMRSYYREMIRFGRNRLPHLQEVGKYIAMEIGSREDRVRAIEEGGGAPEIRLPSDPRLRGVVHEHLTIELAALRDIQGSLMKRIDALEAEGKRP